MRDYMIGVILALIVLMMSVFLAVALVGYAIDKQIENEDNVILLHKLDNK